MDRFSSRYRACLTLALMLLSLPACTIHWRQPRIEPLNTNRIYDAEFSGACAAAESVIAEFGLSVKESRQEDNACLVESGFRVFPDTGDKPTDHLDRVAITGAGGFIGGRYTVTLTVRGVRNESTRVKVVTRVEGYINEEFGYQVLRSTGVIEREMFAALGRLLGTTPIEAN